MQARERFRTFLSIGDAARPFPVDATALAAALAQVSEEALFEDPNRFVRAFMDCSAACGLEAFLVHVPISIAVAVADGRDPTRDDAALALRDGLSRLRSTANDRVALSAVLPGPAAICRAHDEALTADTIEDAVAGGLRLHEFLGPTTLDAVAVLEPEPLEADDLREVDDGLATLWNVARYYAVPSILLVAGGGVEVADVHANAVVAWDGVTPERLLAAGASRVGVPIGDLSVLPPLPRSGFYTSSGPLPASSDPNAVRDLAGQVAAADALT